MENDPQRDRAHGGGPVAEPEEESPVESPDATANGSGDPNMLEHLRARREAIMENTTVDMDIPGYDGELVARYRRSADLWDEMKKAAKKFEKSKNPRKELLSQCDLLSMCCDGMFIRQGGTLRPLNELAKEQKLDLGGDLDEPIGYDKRLAAFFGVDASTAREVVLRVFANDMAVSGHHGELYRWIESSESEDAQDF